MMFLFKRGDVTGSIKKPFVLRESKLISLVLAGNYKDKLISSHIQLSHEKNPPTFHYTGWLIGILILVYYNPYITG